jgi:hypothetical protein
MKETGGVIRAEVGFDHGGVLTDGFRRALGDFFTVVEHSDPLADTHHDAHGVFNEKDGEIELAVDALDEGYELDFLLWIQTGGGFVEQEQARAGGEGAHDFEAALFAVGQAAGGGVAEAGQVEEREQLIGAGGDGGLALAKSAEAKQSVERGGSAVKVARGPDMIEHA